jgi:hypothetical protein
MMFGDWVIDKYSGLFYYPAMISALFLLAALIVVIIVLAKLVFPQLDSSLQNSNQEKVKKEINFGSLMLAIGPIIFGVGLIGIIAQYWGGINPEYKLGITLFVYLILFSVGMYLHFYKKDFVSSVLAEALLILSGFGSGAIIFLFADYLAISQGRSIFGLSEILGLWALTLIPLMYIIRSSWIIGIQSFVHLLWLLTYLGDNLNISELGFNVSNGFSIVNNRLIYFVLILVHSLLFISFYRWHQTEPKTIKNNKVLIYSTGTLAFLTTGAGIWRGVIENLPSFASQNSTWLVVGITSAITVLFFFVDQIGKHYPTKYHIHWLIFGIVAIAGVVGLLPIFSSYFIGMYFLQSGFTLWMLVDFLRGESKVSESLFYVFNATQLIALGVTTDYSSLFQLVVIIAMLIYAMSLHQDKKGFVYYVWISVFLTGILKISVSRLDFYLALLVIGLLIMAVGTLYINNKQKILNQAKD